MDVCTTRGLQGPARLAPATEPQLGVPDAAAAEAAVGSREAGAGMLHGQGCETRITTNGLPNTLHSPGSRKQGTVRHAGDAASRELVSCPLRDLLVLGAVLHQSQRCTVKHGWRRWIDHSTPRVMSKLVPS